MLTGLVAPLRRIATDQASPRVVGMVRIGLGFAAVLRGFEAVRVLRPLTAPDVINFPWFEGLPTLSGPIVTTILALWLSSAAMFMFGLWSRASGALLCAVMAASILLEQQAYSNHLYLLTLLVAMFVMTNPGAALSIDAVRRRRSALPPPESVDAWPLFLMKLQVTTVYLFAAITKLNPEFVSGRVLRVHMGAGLVSMPESLQVPGFLSPLAILAVTTELIIAVFLWRRRLRVVAVVAGIGLHLSIALFMAPLLQLIVFGVVMVSAYGLFFASVRVDEVVDELSDPEAESAGRFASAA